ncbi:MAG: glycosyltransferase [Pseudomonadota bacterium]
MLDVALPTGLKGEPCTDDVSATGKASQQAAPSDAAVTATQTFDGLICLGGEDWWYHNRGHFDFQIMRRLATRFPVLFVNSLGVRMPSLSDKSVFAARIARKLKSFARGLQQVEPGFWVYSPVTAPGRFTALSGAALPAQIRLAAARAGINKPLLWVHCPAGAGLIGRLREVGVVMQRTDRFEAFPEADAAVVGAQIAQIKAAADLVVYAAPHLHDEETGTVAQQVLLTHGVDVERFVAAADAVKAARAMQGVPATTQVSEAGPAARATVSPSDPADMAAIPHPRAGFIGGIDAHTFDPALFKRVVARLPHVQFVMVGGCSLPEGWCPGANVHFLGRKPYDEVAGYMAACDVLLMPWNRSEWIEGCNPIKLKEYLAVGRPVVTTDFPALDGWRDLVHVATDAERFAAAIEAALAGPGPSAALDRVRPHTWDAKAQTLCDAFEARGWIYGASKRR